MNTTTTTTNAPVATQTAHTPGPWIVEHPYGEPGVFVSGPRTELIAKLYLVAEAEANAALIAAAPELLAALEKMVARWDALSVEDLGPGCRAIADKARAAIAKATVA